MPDKTSSLNGQAARDIWGIRFHLDEHKRVRDRVLFGLALVSKLRGCDIVNLRVREHRGRTAIRFFTPGTYQTGVGHFQAIPDGALQNGDDNC
jgi:hypothetical protein